MRIVLTGKGASHQAHQLATATASGSAIRKNTSHHQGQPCAHLARLQPHRAAGPQKGQEGPPTVSPRGRHRPPLQQPSEDEQGGHGGSCPARVRDTPPEDATQKMEKGPRSAERFDAPPFSVRCPLHRGAVWLSQVGVGVLGFRSPTSREIRGAGRRGSGERGCSPPVLLCG